MKVLSLALALLVMGGCSKTVKAPVRIVTHTGPLETFPLELAQDLGFFREAGVEVNIEHASKVWEALLGGSADVVYDGYASVLQAAGAGKALKTFAVVGVRPTLVLVVSPQKAQRIKAVEDLKGMLIGNVSLTSEAYAKHALRQHGLAAGDVNFTIIGGGAAAVAALEYGKVDAAISTTSVAATLQRRAPGLRVLLDPRTPEGTRAFFGTDAIAGWTLSSTSSWLAARPAEARGVARAMVRTLQWLHQHSPEDAYAQMQPSYHTADKENDMEVLRAFIAALSLDGRMQPGASEAVQKVTSAIDEKVLHIDLALTWTNEFLEAK